MKRINKMFGKYKNFINVVGILSYFSAYYAKQKDVGLFISSLQRCIGLYIDYIARLTSFKLPLSL